MKHFDSYLSWGVSTAIALLVAIFGVAGAYASPISMKDDWKRIFAFNK